MNRRRGFLAAAAGAAAVGGAAGTERAQSAPTHPDAELIVACKRHPALLAAWSRELASTNDEAIWRGEGPAGVAYDANRDLIAAARPQTMAGVLAKARAARAEGTMQDGSEEEQSFTSDASAWAWDVVGDVLRLAGEA